MNFRDRVLTSLLMVGSLALGACGSLTFGAHAQSAQIVAVPPSDVIVHVTVEDEGQPVNYLSVSNFDIFENDVLLDSEEISLQLLPREEHAAGHTLVLLDLSGKPTELELLKIARGASHFVEKVSTTQPVTVLAFDGSQRPREVARFARVEQSTKRPVPDLTPFLTGDPSRDLNGNVMSAIKGLTQLLGSQGQKVHYGNFVILVRGEDLAGRATDDELREAMRDSGFEFFAIAPEAAKFSTLGDLGQAASERYDGVESLPMRFQDLGMRVRAAWQSHYVVSYCTPGRAGVRKVRVRVTYESEKGSHRSASARSEFDATGFSGGCKPKITSETPGAVASDSETDPRADSPATPSSAPSTSKKAAPSRPPALDEDPDAAPGEEEDAPIVAPPSSGKYE